MGAEFTLVMGNRTTSSWSLRGWLMVRQAGAGFGEVMVWFRRPETKADILAHSPSGWIPVLKHQGRVIHETLAIAEYLAELFPEAGLWPDDFEARAHARSVSAEMHAGFAALRNHMPMDIGAEKPGEGMGPGVEDDIRRITEIWEVCRQRFGAGGDFLFGAFTIADAMFAPVVTRFRTYRVALGPVCQAYGDTVWDTPDMREWIAGARDEPPPGETP